MGMFRSAGNLINGFLVTKPMTQKPPHSTAGVLYGKALDRDFPSGWYVRAGKPLRLPDTTSMPETDRCIVRGYNARDTAADNV